MTKTSSNLDTPLRDEVDRLAAFDAQGMPVTSLYLSLAPDQHGRERYDLFCRKAFAEQLKTFEESSPSRASLERDIDRIDRYLASEVPPAANGVAIFASSGAGEFFHAIVLEAPRDAHALYVDTVPHLYPLVRLIDQFPRYAVVRIDTNQARILVFALGAVEKRTEVTNEKTRRHSMGGLSQARYQRHTDNMHLHHIKEVVEALDRTVRADRVQHVIIAADDVTGAMFRDALPPALAAKVIDVMRLDREAGDGALAAATMDVLRQRDAETDAERVAATIDAWLAGGLGVAGARGTSRALELGQVDELLITAAPDTLDSPAAADDFVARAHRTGAHVRIIEDPELLAPYDGVAARLRYRA